MVRAYVAILGLVIVAGMFIAGLQVSLDDAGEDVTVSNETWTPDAGNWTELNRSNLAFANYEPTVVVTDENDTTMDRETDYQWNETEGTVFTIVGGGLDGDADAKITYHYAITTEQQREVAAVLGLLPEVIGVLLPILAIVVVVKLLGGG